jgi:hypothetical protein
VRLPDRQRPLLDRAEADLRAAGLIRHFEVHRDEAFSVVVELAPPENAPSPTSV